MDAGALSLRGATTGGECARIRALVGVVTAQQAHLEV